MYSNKLPSPIHHGLHSDLSCERGSVPETALPSPIHHGLHSDSPDDEAGNRLYCVAIPYSSRVAFGLEVSLPKSMALELVAIPYSSRVAFGPESGTVKINVTS